MGMPNHKDVKNNWLKNNFKLISDLRNKCVEYSMSGSYGGNLPLETLIKIIDLICIEIERLEKENIELKSKN